jgi:hypothetical protein
MIQEESISGSETAEKTLEPSLAQRMETATFALG